MVDFPTLTPAPTTPVRGAAGFPAQVAAYLEWMGTVAGEIDDVGDALELYAAGLNALATGGALALDLTVKSPTADADPGLGGLRFNNFASQKDATVLRVDDADDNGGAWANLLAWLGTGTSTNKAVVVIRKKSDPNAALSFAVTAVTPATGYSNLTVVNLQYSAASPFAAEDDVVMQFTPVGDAGQVGSLAIGSVIYATSAPSANWKLCDGSVYTKSSYSTLATALGSLPGDWAVTSRNSNILTTPLVGAYGGGKYVVAGGNGLGASSADAVSWTSRTLNLSTNLAKICFWHSGFSKFYMGVSAGSNVAYSGDGDTWTAVAHNATSATDISAMAGSPTRLVVGGTTNANIGYSSDGTSFTNAATGVTTAVGGLAYGNSTFVAIGTGGGVATSPGTDGATWTLRNGATVPTGIMNGLRFFSGYFWVWQLSSNLLTAAWRSTDGATWERVTLDTGGMATFPLQSAIVEGPDGLFTSGQNGALWFSRDFLTWQRGPRATAAQVGSTLNLLAIGNGIVLANANVNSTVWTAPYYGYSTSTQFRVPRIGADGYVDTSLKAYIKAT